MSRPIAVLTLLGMILFCAAARRASAVDNPVLRGIADSGVMKHRGQYYLMGVGTNGQMYVSDDLIHWDGPHPAMTMNNKWARGGAATDYQIHACDLTYLNGVFHLYWSVNYLDAELDIRQIGHAVATEALGPYVEPVTETWFDGRIDPQLFVNSDGTLYFYKVLFEHGNVIYGERLKDPWTHSEEPTLLLSTLKGTWEQLDPQGFLVNEAPWVFKYRNRYYMLYGANHVGMGHYAVGCAEADTPLGFSNATKYPHAVLDSRVVSVSTESTDEAQEFRIHNCGQPSVVRGPNGFEWWVVYFARYDRSPSSQAVDRIFFHNRKLFIDGPTSRHTSGYHPDPTLPTFRDLFHESDREMLSERWQLEGGEWTSAKGVLEQKLARGTARSLIKSASGTHYLFESSVRLLEGEGKAGVLAFWQDRDNFVSVLFDGANRKGFLEIKHDAVSDIGELALPEAFDFDVFHTIQVRKNGRFCEIRIDGVSLTREQTLETPFDGGGIPGLITVNSSATFDGVTYTLGWDEFDQGIHGWGKALCGTEPTGECRGSLQGLTLESRDTQARVFKGDVLGEYEFMTQICFLPTRPDQPVTAGIYAVYVDETTWLSATVENHTKSLIIRGQISGAPLDEIQSNIESNDSMNLRIVKKEDKVLLFVDGVLNATVQADFPPSQVGLMTQGGTAIFNDMTLFDISSRESSIEK